MPSRADVHSVTGLLADLRSQDTSKRDFAADQIWRHYFPKLLALAKRQLSDRVRRREDEHDVVQSACRSFFARQRRGDFELGDRNELWQLLVAITLRKSVNAAKRHQARKRDYRQEYTPAGDNLRSLNDWALEQMDAGDPTPHEASALAEELQFRLSRLPEGLRQIALWLLEGYTYEEIAGKFGCVARTVIRKVQRIREEWLADESFESSNLAPHDASGPE